MSNVRQHLEAALQEITREKTALANQIRTLAEQERQLNLMLGFQPTEKNGSRISREPNSALAELIDHMLVTHEEFTSSDVKAAAEQEGVPFKDGRSIQAILAGMVSHERAERTENGTWRRKQRLKLLKSRREE